MAVTLKRKRGTVSYKEPSSGEDISDASSQGRLSRGGAAARSRRSARHSQEHDESNEDEPVRDYSPPHPPRCRLSRAARGLRGKGKQRMSYKEDSSAEDGSEERSDADFEVEHSPNAQSRPLRTPKASSQGTDHKPKKRSRRLLILGGPVKPNNAAPPPEYTKEVVSDGRIPNWAALPYHVLLQVFVYASHPLHDDNMRPFPSITWLARVARVCTPFTKPALTALYRNPPIFAMRQTRRDLVNHLIKSPDTTRENYQVMVKRVEVDVTQLSALTDAMHSVEDLASLLRSLTTLRELDFFNPIDRPPFRTLKRTRRWTYPNEVFEALRNSEARLRSWRWNSTFCTQNTTWIRTVHEDAAFQSLRDVSLVQFHPDPSFDDYKDPQLEEVQSLSPSKEELLASALIVLPKLRSLSFETCGILNERLLPLLPTTLVSLSITNCGELLSDALQPFLLTHGSYLEELVLHHNQALNLSFLVDLKHSCPRLEVLRMDTTYYSSLELSSDNEPLYETLLGENEIPTWPSSLRTIDMEYLRKWNSNSATNFFTSLIDAAEELPLLRELTILAMVNTDWRQRAAFRMKWTARFKHVFARKWIEPSAHLMALRAYREWKEQQENSLDNGAVADDDETPIVEGQTADGSKGDDQVASLRGTKNEKWGSKRLRDRLKANASYDEDSTTGSQTSNERPQDEEKVLYAQGRCHTVIFRIDNFRPREEIYGEADFLDAEPSGDEEWNGNDDNDDRSVYAW